MPVHSARRAEAVEPIRSILYVVNDYGDTPHLANPFYGVILNGAVGISQSYNADVRPAVLQHDHPLDAPLPDALATKADGVILASPYPQVLVSWWPPACASDCARLTITCRKAPTMRL